MIMQFVTAEDRENVGLTVIVLKTADKKAKIMRILAPLVVLLPSGLGLKMTIPTWAVPASSAAFPMAASPR